MSAPAIGIGMLGYAFMGKAHAHAYRTLSHIVRPAVAAPRLVSIAGRSPAALAGAAEQYGFERYTTDWHAVVTDDAVDVFDNCGPNHLHAEPTIAAAGAGKHVVCEKPLGRDAAEAFDIWQRVEQPGVVHMCAFNYRFVPAVRLARELIESGAIGSSVLHFRGRYLQDWGATAADGWRFDPELAGSGALGDLGVHLIDLARYLAGEITTVSASTRTFRDRRGVDDAFAAVCDLERGGLATLEASRFALGRKNSLRFEISGEGGALAFDLERPNELLISEEGAGFRTLLVTEPDHPFVGWWWPPGHVLGWEHTFVHELEHALGAVVGRNRVAPHGATFEDGYRASAICDAIQRAAATGDRQTVRYLASAATTA